MTEITHTVMAREQSLLGALLNDNAQLSRVNLRAGDFVSREYAEVFDCIRRLISAGKVVDAVTCAEQLERESARGDWIIVTANLQYNCLAPSNAPAYAAGIARASRERRAAQIGETLIREFESDDVIPNAIRELMELTSLERDHACHVSDAMRGAMDELEAVSEGRPPGVRTAMKDLDDALGGLHDEDLIVVAARASMGKTAFMLNLLSNASCAAGVVSGEQGRGQIGMRLLAIDGLVSLHRMRTGKLYDEEWVRVTRVVNAMKQRSIWMYDKPAPTISEIVAQARAWKFHHKIGILMIDYLQKIRGGQGENFRLQVGDITIQLKDLARELKIPVVVLAQVNRDVERRPLGSDGLGRMPYMSDIAESAIIEQEADQIITLYRPEVYDDQTKFAGIAYANICKNRHGPVGHKSLSWRGEFLKFGDLARDEVDDAPRQQSAW